MFAHSQSGGRDSLVFSLVSGFGLRSAPQHITRALSTLSRLGEFQCLPGVCIWASAFFFHSISLYQRVDAVMAGSSSSTILTDTLLSSAFTRLHPEIGSRQASHHRLPEASMYVNLADDMHLPASAGGAASRIQYTMVLLIPSSFSIFPPSFNLASAEDDDGKL